MKETDIMLIELERFDGNGKTKLSARLTSWEDLMETADKLGRFDGNGKTVSVKDKNQHSPHDSVLVYLSTAGAG